MYCLKRHQRLQLNKKQIIGLVRISSIPRPNRDSSVSQKEFLINVLLPTIWKFPSTWSNELSTIWNSQAYLFFLHISSNRCPFFLLPTKNHPPFNNLTIKPSNYIHNRKENGHEHHFIQVWKYTSIDKKRKRKKKEENISKFGRAGSSKPPFNLHTRPFKNESGPLIYLALPLKPMQSSLPCDAPWIFLSLSHNPFFPSSTFAPRG